MSPQCGVCHDAESKYKCPICELRYCSIPCYKTHKTSHENQQNTALAQENPQPKRDRPGTTQRVPKLDFTGFENDQNFQRLIVRYPLLLAQLQAIYGLTLEPGPDEARTWNRQPLPGAPQPSFRGGRGRGQRGHRGRGGRGGWEDAQREERQHGPWTKEKGDKEALSVIKKMKAGDGRDEDMSEGIREFVELCRMKFAKEEG